MVESKRTAPVLCWYDSTCVIFMIIYIYILSLHQQQKPVYCFHLVIRGGLRASHKGEGVSGLIKSIPILYWLYNVSDCYLRSSRTDGTYIFIVSLKASAAR